MQTEPSFAEWAAARQGRLVRAAYLMTGDLHAAEDLVQEALVKVCQRWSRLREGHPEAYARRIIYRDHVSGWRRRREYASSATRERAAPEGRVVEDVTVVRDALLRLPRGQRAALVLRFFEDLTAAETATVLGVSVGTVKSQTHDALRNLRRLAPELAELVGEEASHDCRGLRDLLERASDVQARDLVDPARLEARRRTLRSRAGAAAAVAACTALVVAGVAVTDRHPDTSPERPAREPTSPTATPTSSVPTPERDPDAIAQPVWDPFTVVDAPVRDSSLPLALAAPTETPASVLDDPVPDVVLAWPEEGRELLLLSTNGEWRSIPDSADPPGAYARPMVGAPALSADGHRVAFSTEAGVRVVDVTTGGDTTHPWPEPLAGPWDTAPELVWRGDGLVIMHWRGTWSLDPDGRFARAGFDAGYGDSFAVAPDGSAYVKDTEQRELLTLDGDRVQRRVPVPWWGQRLAADDNGLVVFVGGTDSTWGRNGPMVVDATTGAVEAYAPIRDPNSVYSDNGHLTPLGFLDPDTVLLKVGPMDFDTMDLGEGEWHLIAWSFRTGAFERILTGPQAS